ncbi:MAG: arylesterase [Desulfobulbus sp.]|jgi:acyl-CoA thioesterase-1|nr:arylesterase [Desulfobulbus sp.]
MPRLLNPLLVLLVFACTVPALAGPTVLFLGDSLTAGLGVEPEEAYPYLLGERLVRDGFAEARMINGGISGSTSASAPGRLRWYARVKPDVLFLALGANDGLRGLTVAELEKNLEAVIVEARRQGMRVLLAGMELPPNYGDVYTADFRRVYADLAGRHGLPLLPFLLEGVGGVAELNQADGIHPNAKGHRRIADHVFPFLRDQLRAAPPVQP